MNRQWVRLASSAIFGLAVMTGGEAHALTNLALTSEGAAFVAASSATPVAKQAALTEMQNNLISSNPKPWYYNGDKRYIFAHGDQDQWIEISLGKLDKLSEFGVTFSKADRPVVGPFYVETSVNGTTWTTPGAEIVNPLSEKDLLSLSMPTPARFIKFFFGPSSKQYDDGGSAVNEVFAFGVASPAPEPPAWAMMIAGVGGIGAAMRKRRDGAAGRIDPIR